MNFMGLLANNELEISDDKGNTQRMPLVGAFKNMNGYYVVVLAQEHGKEEFVMYRVDREGDREFIQVITDVNEWDMAYTSWLELVEDVKGKDVKNNV